MKTKLLNIVFIAFVAIFLAGCRKKENLNANNIVGWGGDTWVKTELDEWLYTNFTKPYNIEVKYKWDRSELSSVLYKNVGPIKKELVKPVMQALKEIWIEPYIAAKDQNFFKKYCQKQFYLLGTPYYEFGQMGLGIAEGGRKVILFNLNTFENANKGAVKQVLHTIHHEFGHILNQNRAVDPEYQKITPNDYIATWFNITSQEEYLGLGFITPYSRANKDEDFVEMLATLLEGGQAYFDDIINNLFIYDGRYIKRNATGVYEKNTDARDKLLNKKAMVVSYINSWGINFADLQAKTQEAIERFIPTPDLHTILGIDENHYNIINVNPQKLTGLSAKFLTAFNTANEAMLAAPLPKYIDNIALIFDKEQMMLFVNYFHSLEPPHIYNNNFYASYYYTISKTGDGLIKLRYTKPQPQDLHSESSRIVQPYLSALLTYFNNQEFKVRWVDDIIPQSKGIFGGLVKKKDPSSYVFGTLGY